MQKELSGKQLSSFRQLLTLRPVWLPIGVNFLQENVFPMPILRNEINIFVQVYCATEFQSLHTEYVGIGSYLCWVRQNIYQVSIGFSTSY